MISDKEQEMAHWALNYALKKGCNQCRITFNKSSQNGLELRNHQIDKLTKSVEQQLNVALYINERYGTFYTNKMNRDEIALLIDHSLEGIQLLAPDAIKRLPDPSLYYKGNGINLDQFDPQVPTIEMDKKMELAEVCLQEIESKASHLISMESNFNDVEGYQYLLDSQGFEQSSQATNLSLVASVSLQDKDDARPQSYWYDSSIYWNDLQKRGIGSKAVERAVQKIGQRKIASGKYTVVIDTEVISTLTSAIFKAMYGQALYNGNSFLVGKLGKPIANHLLTLYDLPHEPRQIYSQLFNNEGIATMPRTLISEGVLHHYFIDPYYGKKLKMTPTINDLSLVRCEEGMRTAAEIIGDLPSGLYITGFNGGNNSSTTGDFSYGIEGLLIEQGQLTQPFSEMIISGNMLSFWESLIEVGNDTLHSGSVQLPTMVFENVAIS